jgi:hypothetical protein
MRSLPGFLVAVVAVTAPALARAQWPGNTADTLPRGIFSGQINYVHSDTGLRSQRGALTRDEEPAQEATLLTDLIGPSSTFGNALVEYRATADVLAPALFYGLHERLSVGFFLPVYLDARVEIHQLQVGTGALGYNQDFAEDMDHQSPVLRAGDPRALQGAEGVQRILTDVFHYQPLETWQSSGLGDLQLIARVKLHSSEHVRIAVQPGAEVPTGAPDDPDNLVDFGLGTGQLDLGALGLVDLAPRPWLVLNLRGGYVWQLPNEQRARVYEDATIPVAPIEPLPEQFGNLGRERQVVRDLGDLWQLGATLHLRSGLLFATACYETVVKGRDRYSSSAGVHPAMAVGTDYDVSLIGGSVGLDLVRPFMRGKAPLPIMVELIVSQTRSSLPTENRTSAMTKLTLFFGKKPKP